MDTKQVFEERAKLIDLALSNNGKPENFKAVNDYIHEYGVY